MPILLSPSDQIKRIECLETITLVIFMFTIFLSSLLKFVLSFKLVKQINCKIIN